MPINHTQAKFYIGGVEVVPPKEWKTASVLATFDNESNQPSLSISNFTFANKEARILQNYIDSGNIFEGLDFKLELYNDLNEKIVFDGIIDLTDDLSIDDFKHIFSVKFKKLDNLLTLEEKLGSLSFGYLESLGEIGNSDYTEFSYIVQKKFNVIENIALTLVIYMLTKELKESIKTISKDAADVTAHATGGATGVVAATAWAIAVLAIDTAYTVAIVASLIKMTEQLINNIIPFKRKCKIINYKTALINVAAHLGYGFETNITDLDSCYYLPSNLNIDEDTLDGFLKLPHGTDKGIPNISDNGYTCLDFFEMMRKMFNGKFDIIDNKIVFYNKDDIFWQKQAPYIIPSNRDKRKTFNTSELIANRRYNFEVDYTEEHTISGYKGSSYEVITQLNSTSPKTKHLIKGLEEIRFGCALGKRKDKLTGFEKALKDTANFIDNSINFLGGKSNLSGLIKSNIGLLMVSNNNYQTPKSLKIKNERLVNRSEWSAKYIYNNYYRGTSFVSTINDIDGYAQKEVYNEVKVGFGMNDFIKLISCSQAKDENGYVGNIKELSWTFDSDSALISYFIRKKYTNKLSEIFIEPENIDI
jgi:hypothetical protein